MGCDIHLIVERQTKNGRWDTLISRVRTPRNYILFGNLVKGHYRFPNGSGRVPERGLPEDFHRSYSWDHFHYSITDDPEVDIDFHEKRVSRERAKLWRSEIVRQGDFPYDYVRDPDYHTYSWLTTQEFEDALISARLDSIELREEDDLRMAEVFANNFNGNSDDARRLLKNFYEIISSSHKDPVEDYEAILNYMRTYKGQQCRVVFAFDN